MDRPNVIKMQGNPLTLTGQELKVGDKAPDFTLLDNELKPVKLSDTKGKARLLSIVPSLDTTTCSIQTRTFNEKLAELSDKAASYTISADLPFAQQRFASENSIDKTRTLSDYQTMSFGNDYGLTIKELRLLARAVIVVDKDDTITHMQIVPEVSSEPDYTTALEALKKATE
jgi:thiol peroxidase